MSNAVFGHFVREYDALDRVGGTGNGNDDADCVVHQDLAVWHYMYHFDFDYPLMTVLYSRCDIRLE
jgi:hypothetical protein